MEKQTKTNQAAELSQSDSSKLLGATEPLNDIVDNINPLQVKKFSEKIGNRIVWLTWYKEMKRQGREVKEHQHSWETLPENDKDLDKIISYQLIIEFLIWLREKK